MPEGSPDPPGDRHASPLRGLRAEGPGPGPPPIPGGRRHRPCLGDPRAPLPPRWPEALASGLRGRWHPTSGAMGESEGSSGGCWELCGSLPPMWGNERLRACAALHPPGGGPSFPGGPPMGGLVVAPLYLQGEGRSPSGLLTPSFTPPPVWWGLSSPPRGSSTPNHFPAGKRLAGRVVPCGVLRESLSGMGSSPRSSPGTPSQRQLYEEDPLGAWPLFIIALRRSGEAQQDAWNSAQGMKLR